MSSTHPLSLTGSPGYSYTLFSRRLEVQAVHDELELLYGLQPLPDCLPGWKGDAKSGYIEKLGDMTTMFVSVRAEVDAAIAALTLALAEFDVV